MVGKFVDMIKSFQFARDLEKLISYGRVQSGFQWTNYLSDKQQHAWRLVLTFRKKINKKKEKKRKFKENLRMRVQYGLI